MPHRHDRLPGGVSRQHQGGRGTDRRQHAAHRRGLRVHAVEQPGADARRVGAALLPTIAPLLPKLPHLAHVVVSRGDAGGHFAFDALLARGSDTFDAAPTCPDDVCFWLYSSGSTGMPKGTMHVHASLIETAELYGRGVLGIREDDVVFSAAKLFFAYGLGNALTFPLAVGATTVLMAERPTPSAVAKRLTAHRPTIFYGVPTLYAAMLASPDLPREGRRRSARLRVRRRSAAGEHRQALDCALRRRDPRRHRLDGDAAHLPVEPSRRRCATARPACRCRATTCASSTTRCSPCRRGKSAISTFRAPPQPTATGTTARRAARRSRACGRKAATSTLSIATACTAMPGAATTC